MTKLLAITTAVDDGINQNLECTREETREEVPPEIAAVCCARLIRFYVVPGTTA